MTELVLLLMSVIVAGGVAWTVWDIRSDLRRHRPK
ncbi:uncharacterized protein DUF2537 [Saccharopolyspora erythraea NRRL 2338]|uniref:Uncharacterized protein n=1 Tax=Saccharopolyspora erythraea (strain ATCC 11635 / DSM 40517 / JCM 4748 / NBRC 13426 / NCIMB 8594 / NRRL 2338) TaxID=405948 RepID=A4FFM2_SACEN|nr:DUF2537 domain-containing protein [Saccharopolyspora erythraea]EQD81736.1 hypothetical protein N599_34485 [Saccharopolyspora erythraea D]PFG96566.1 uncharacterized protein DUF2537 [Saccharopolyspora erythraea NRRL 2338]QRK93050.1 DUF2537 domain-containing protein [Saccharopolyspora erythraea]CAM02847.1 hypothetical protein SACE_3573 [Saccharopolyspora erythraea NRRL 2338]